MFCSPVYRLDEYGLPPEPQLRLVRHQSMVPSPLTLPHVSTGESQGMSRETTTTLPADLV